MDIETYLKEKGISQTEFAKRLGVTQGAVWQWISGESRITAERALEIEKKTGGEISRHELRSDIFGPELPPKLNGTKPAAVGKAV